MKKLPLSTPLKYKNQLQWLLKDKTVISHTCDDWSTRILDAYNDFHAAHFEPAETIAEYMQRTNHTEEQILFG